MCTADAPASAGRCGTSWPEAGSRTKNRDVHARKSGSRLRFIPSMDAIGSHTVVRMLPVTRADHLDPGLVASYLEDVCDAEERSRVEAHLAECTDCCEELIALEETIRTLPTRRKGRYVIPLVALGAAAALAGLIVLRPSDNPVELPEGTPIVQRSQPEERSSIAILGPEFGAVVEAGEVILRWAPLEPDARYLVTV